MIKIGVGVLTYNCVTELKRCLDSLTDFYPVFVIDGRWKDFPGETKNSNDGTIDLAESYSNVITVLSGDKLEPFNRNLTCIHTGKFGCDVLFIVDSDETVDLPNGYNAFANSLERMIRMYPDDLGFSTWFDSTKNATGQSRRMMLNPMFVRYRDRHNKMYFLDKEVWAYTKHMCPNVIIHENKTNRTKERELTMRTRNLANPKH